MSVGGDLLGTDMKGAIDSFIATLTDDEKRNFNDTTRVDLFKSWGNAIDPFIPPVGAIIAWIPSTVIAGIPVLPANWAICDGSTVNDDESPIDGATLPDLRAHFLRGTGTHGSRNKANGNAYAGPSLGAFVNDKIQGHYHAASGTTTALAFTGSTGTGGTAPVLPSFVTGAVTVTVSSPTNDGTNGVPRTGDETIPTSYGVYWIIRIK